MDQIGSWESMALSIIQKTNATLKSLYRKCRYLTVITKKLLIQCHFVWFAGLSQSLKNRQKTTQNKLITGNKRSWSNYSLSCLKIKSGIAPGDLGEYFSLASSVHGYFIRFWDNGSYTIPKVKGFGKKSFAYKGCMLWNDLPLYIRK